jgi:hypothetical protein
MIKNTPEKLLAFLSAKTDAEILACAEDAQPYYASYPDDSNEGNYDVVTLLEIASEEGKSDHVRVLLESSETEYSAIFRSFYRALEQQQQGIALQLLDHLNVYDLAKILLVKSDPLFSERHDHYLNKISKAKHYVFGFNRHAVTGNIALIMAAALPDALLFNQLISYPELNNQLEYSGITAFLSATLNADGGVKASINTAIVFQLLAIPVVKLYAEFRLFDFETLLTGFKQHTAKVLAEKARADAGKALAEKVLADAAKAFAEKGLADDDESIRSNSVITETTVEAYSRPVSRMDSQSPADSVVTQNSGYFFTLADRKVSLSPGGSRVMPIRYTPSLFGSGTPRPDENNRVILFAPGGMRIARRHTPSPGSDIHTPRPNSSVHSFSTITSKPSDDTLSSMGDSDRAPSGMRGMYK